ncbi:MAG: hypothetical protein CME71_00605 [Halobacteriovorax sp.]|nr:hypothetical protein [Halobacteriovorax sp.]
MLNRIFSLLICFLLAGSAHASWKHKGHKPKIFKNCFEENDKLIVYTPEWFDSAHENGVYVFGKISDPNSNTRVLVQGHSAKIDSLGNFYSKVSAGDNRKALPIKVELQYKKHNKWKTSERDIILVKIDRKNRLLAPIAGLSCFQVNPNVDYLINCTASSTIDLDGALRDFFWIVNDGDKVLRGENIIFDAGSDLNQNIALVAIDDDGLQSTATTSVEVAPLNTAPSISISLSSYEGVVPVVLSANANVSDSENNLQSIRWSASNGQYAEGANFSVQVDIPGPLTLTVVATDTLGAQSKEVVTFTGKAPIIPDPVLLAPETKQNEITEFKDTVAFLYSGPNPIQKTVTPGTIKEDKLAIVTGRVLDTAGEPIVGTKVSLNQKGNFGHTFTRVDGKFDLALNAGTYTLKYQNAGYIPAQRDFTVGVGGYKQEEDVVLVKLSQNVTPINMASPIAQLAVGESVSDPRGDRTHILITAPGTTATATLPDGSEQQLPLTSIRITEFTQGEDGPKRMPADLPSATAYTLAANFHVDEAAAIGAETVTFNKPVFYYVDNFLSAPAGSAVPLATYDEKCGAWIPGKDGYIIDILGVVNGYAQIDANGDGVVDDQDILAQYGVSTDELELLASRYIAGDSIARYELYHFSNVDANYGQGTNSSGNSPDVSGTGSHNNTGSGNSACGSIINLQDCSLGEVIDLVGTELKLFYNSKFDANNKNGLEYEISLSGDEIDAKSIRLRYNISGQNFEHHFPAQPNLKHQIVWDGKNKYGKNIFGNVPVDIEVTYLYDSFYRYFEYNDLATFGSTPWQDLQPGETIPAPDFEVAKNFRVYLSNQFHKPVSNMFLSEHHFYDPGQRRIFYGNGTQSNIAEKSKVTVKPFDKFFGATAKHPITGEIYFTKYFDEQGNYNRTCIQKMTATGDIVRVAGRAPCYETSNDIPTQRYPDKDLTKFVYINKMMFDEKGNLYFNDVGANILYRFNEASGSLERIAGTGLYPNVVSDDTFYDYIDQEAYEADFPFYSFTLGQQGWVYISTYSGVYMLNPCADEYKLRGYWYNPFFMPKYLENINMDKATGTLYYGNGLDSLNPNGPGVAWMHLGYVRPDGVSGYLSRIGTNPFCAFNQPCGIEPPRRFMEDVTVDGYVQLLLDDGSILTTSSFHTNFDFSQGVSGAVVRRMPTGEIETLVGGGEIPTNQNFTSPVDGADLRIPWSMESLIELDDGNILVTTWNGNKSFVFNLPRPENQTLVNEHRVADSSRGEIYLFDKKGRHLRTLDMMTEALKWEFTYNLQGDIISAKDRNGLITTVERDNDGQPTAIIAPLGQRTELSV